MKQVLYLTSGILKNFTREKLIIIILILFPILLIGMATLSAPEGNVPIKIDEVLIQPFPSATTISVILYSMTAVILMASITSFFISYQLKSVTPRLRIFSYSGFQIGAAFILIILAVSAISAVAVVTFGSFWVTPREWLGYFLALLFGAVIFSTIGLIITEIVDSKELGLFIILTFSVIDTSFLENPIISRRYHEPWTVVMPAHNPIQMLFHSTFENTQPWIEDLPLLILYELILIFVYLLIRRKK